MARPSLHLSQQRSIRVLLQQLPESAQCNPPLLFDNTEAQTMLNTAQQQLQKALPCSINAGVIKLIHKKGAKDDITNWRPLTMLNTAYKVYAKAIANRITILLMKWISKEQKGFIKGRKLVEPVISLWEGFENASESGQDFVFVKIDFDKAYDRLEWSFILACLEAMGFGPMLILFIRTPFGNARARIAINDSLSPAFDLSRSVRQGCPLAPLLFAWKPWDLVLC
ncbi:hypothetical protein L7F22_033997 [Adiantum nelumboides]|nr:hypothetical protein [Adiantum nelumboides]